MRRFCVYLTLFWAFLLGSRDGFLALWIPPEQEPAYLFPCRIASLPPADQKLLEEGIQVESKAELMQLLEDYVS
jgi:hypothetical protein